MQGDVIFIENVGKTAAVNGEVYRKGIFELKDNEGLERETAASSDLGFTGRAAVHPKHLSTINQIFIFFLRIQFF